MTTTVTKTVLVDVPVSTAYNQWTQFEDFPQFMGGVKSVTQLSDDRLQWVAEIAGVKRQWEARIVEQVPDTKVAWAATEGATNAGAVTFEDLGGTQTSVTLHLEYEPEGLVEAAGDKLGIVEKQAQSDLERFKSFIEDEGYATGAWRGDVGTAAGTPGVEAADSSRGDDGKAGVSLKAAAAGLGVAAAAAAGIAAATSGNKDDEQDTQGTATDVTPMAETTSAADMDADMVEEDSTIVLDDATTGGATVGDERDRGTGSL